jgi:iron complex outermembrane receptor protein
MSIHNCTRTGGPRAALATLATLILTGPGLAQTPASGGTEAAPVQKLAAVEVTGDKIKPFTTANVDMPRTMDDPQPYFMFDAPTLERSGATSVENFLKTRLTMNTVTFALDQSFFIGGVGSSVNLRGFGTNQTLVLVNGRRGSAGNLSNNGGGTQIDLNGIPIGAVDRIEVLTGSGSAIYGASAIGGVVNVVLKRNYAGGEFRTTYQNTFDSDTPIKRADLTYGFGLEQGRTQVMLTASWGDNAVLSLQDRVGFLSDYNTRVIRNNPSYSGYLTLGATPNIVGSPAPGTLLTLKNGGGALGANSTYIRPGTAPTTSFATLAEGLRANAGQLNLNPADTTQIKGLRAPMGTPSTTKNFSLSVRRQMHPRVELFTEFSTSSVRTEKDFSISYSMTVPATSPANPFNQAVNLHVPFPNAFPGDSNSVTRRATAGFIVKLPFHWVAHTDYTWSYGGNSYGSSSSTLQTVELNAALASGALNPFVDTQRYPLDIPRYLGTQTWLGYSTLNDVNLRLAGPVGRLPAGAPLLTLGLGRRQEGTGDSTSYVDYPNFRSRNTHSISLGKKQVTESAYVEAQVPLIGEANALPFVRELDLQLAGRAEDFRVRTGTATVTVLPAPTTTTPILNNRAKYVSTKPTAGFRLRPRRDFMFRASYSEGFVPPSYSQLLLNPIPSATLATVTDPRRGNTSRAVATLGGGNPDIVPEESKTWNAGVVWEPTFSHLKGLRVNLEWYSIEKRNNIGTISAQQLVENEAIFPGRVTRDPVPAGDPYPVGPITLVNQMSMNLYRAFNEGFDLNVTYRKRTDTLGTFDVNFLTTLASHYKRRTTLNAPYLDYVNFPTSSGPLSFRYNAGLIWDLRQWTAGWSMTYYGRARVSGPPISTSTVTIQAQGANMIPSSNYHDCFVAYRFGSATPRLGPQVQQALKGAEIQIGIKNILNTIPDFNVGAHSYWYDTFGDLRLREYRISLKKPF